MSFMVREMVHRRRLEGAPSMPSRWRSQFDGLLRAIQAETFSRHPDWLDELHRIEALPVNVNRKPRARVDAPRGA